MAGFLLASICQVSYNEHKDKEPREGGADMNVIFHIDEEKR